MKKLFIMLALMFMSIGGFAQSAQDIINSYKDHAGLGIMEMNKMMINMASAAAKTDEEKEALKNVDSITVGMIDTDELAAEIGNKLEALKDNGYGTIDAQKEDMKAKVFAKTEDDIITEIVVLAKGDGHNILMLIKGKIDPAQVGSLVK
ncbi:MAG: DUF4252 domain-containing protein [Prevotella sp.]|nr:DUF4252 domain-containing protein [Prevotella sp.]